jgi:hypothetical protein
MLAACAGRPKASPAVVSPPPTPVISVEGWEFAAHPGRVVRTRSYRIFTTSSDQVLLQEMPIFLECAMEQYTTAMGPLPRPSLKLDTFLMGERDEWESLTRQLMGEQASTYLRIQRGGFASGGRALLWSIGQHDTLAIAAHEGWHQYTQRSFREELPSWLEEGAAVYMEGFVPDPLDPARPIFLGWANTERFDQLVRAEADQELVPLSKLLGQTPQDLINASTEATLTYYAQLWALVHFLKDGDGGRYRVRLQELIADAAAGRMRAMAAARTGRRDRIFQAYFGMEPAAMEASYDAFVAGVVRPGSREKIAAGSSPFER